MRRTRVQIFPGKVERQTEKRATATKNATPSGRSSAVRSSKRCQSMRCPGTSRKQRCRLPHRHSRPRSRLRTDTTVGKQSSKGNSKKAVASTEQSRDRTPRSQDESTLSTSVERNLEKLAQRECLETDQQPACRGILFDRARRQRRTCSIQWTDPLPPHCVASLLRRLFFARMRPYDGHGSTHVGKRDAQARNGRIRAKLTNAGRGGSSGRHA